MNCECPCHMHVPGTYVYVHICMPSVVHRLQEGTNAIVVHFSPFYNILKEHSLAVLGAITEAATQADHPLEFLLSKQGTDIVVLFTCLILYMYICYPSLFLPS
jgi:hypothetical protein